MTEQELRGLSPQLNGFLDRFLFCCDYTQTFAHLGTYVRGLLSDLERKTAEPIAIAAGVAPRTLQQFLKDHAWSFADIRSCLQRHTAQLLRELPDDGLGTVGLIDETSALKKGDKTPGVQRQYLGCVGKVDNGIVTVHTGVCKGFFKCLLDFDLFLPEGWSADRKRCRAAGIPDELVYRPKWQIALGQLDRLEGSGVRLDWLTFDEGYGLSPGFIAGLLSRQLRFVGEVPRSLSCLAAHKSGRRPAEELKGRPAEEVVRTGSVFRGQDWRVLRLSRQTDKDQVWRVKAARVWLSGAGGWSAQTFWLIWACNDESGEEKFFLSNAAEDAEVEVLVRVAFRRWNVEHSFRVCKQELGMMHFEGRNYLALMRHLCLSTVAVAFVAGHTERRRGEKSGPDDGAGVPRVEAGVPALAGSAARDDGVGLCVVAH